MESSSPFKNSFRLTTPSAKPPSSSVSDSLKQLLDQSRQLHAGIASASSLHPSVSGFNQFSGAQNYNSSSSALTGSLPTVQLGLDQIEAQSRRLISKIRKNDTLDASLSLFGAGPPNSGRDGRSVSALNGQGTSSKAHYLLAGAGVNAEELGKTIDGVDLRGTFEPLQPLQDTDVEGYLKHEHEQSIIASIEEGRRQTIQDFYQILDRSMRQNWEDQKELLFEELARHQPPSSTDGGNLLSVFPTNSSINNPTSEAANSPNSSPEHTSRKSSKLPFSESAHFSGIQSTNRPRTSSGQVDVHRKMMKYDQAVIKLNERRLQNAYFPIVQAFKEASLSVSEEYDKSTQTAPLTDTWNLLAQLVQEKNIGSTDQDHESIIGINLTISAERRYAKSYLGDPQSLEARSVRKQLADGAKAHLEKQFLSHITSQIAAHPVEATLGGDPSIANKVRAYVDLKFCKNGTWTDKRLEIVNNTPVWARIFYLLRIGQIQEAVKFTKTYEQHIRKTEPNFLSYLSSWASSPQNRLSKTLRDRFLVEYNQRIREVNGAEGGFGSRLTSQHSATTNVDPFKHAVYKIIGRVEIQRKNVPVAIASTEDWIWLQLILVKESDQDHQLPNSSSSISATHDRYGLEEFGQVITKYGENHFDPNGNRPLMYFRVLLMSGQFEKAILFLQQKPHYQVDAIHFAIVLAYYGLLRISDSTASTEGQAFSPKGRSSSNLPSVNFARLIYRYTRLFSKSAPEVAIQYLYLICLNADAPPPSLGQNQITLCHTYIGDLAVETASREEILGDVRNDGTRIPGMIERDLSLIKLFNQREYLETIVKQAAERAFRERRLRDAIRLFNIAEEYDRVIAVINIELGASLFQPGSKPASTRMDEDMDGSRLAAKGATVSLTASEDIVAVANNVLAHYDRTTTISSRITRKNRDTCALLLRLKTVLGLHEQGKNEQAMAMLDSIDLLPPGNDLVQIIRKSEQVKDLDDTIVKNLDVIVLTGMNILFQVFSSFKDSPYGDASRQAKMSEIKTKARAITTFAGMLRYRLSPETYSQLSRLQAYLH